MRTLKLVDLFCGCGALTYGFASASDPNGVWIEPYMAIDHLKSATDSFERNFPQATVLTADVSKVQASSLGLGGELIVIGGPPCQGFSAHTRRNGSSDPRNGLVFHYARFVEELRPIGFVLENVPGVQEAEYGVWESAIRHLRQAGYRVTAMTLNAAHFGTPQNRTRTFLCGVLRPLPPVAPPLPTHGQHLSPLRSVRDAIADLCPLEPGQRAELDELHFASFYDPKSIERFQNIPSDGGSRSDLPSHLTLQCHQGEIGYKDVYGRMWWDKPAPTITGGCLRPSKGRFLHPIQDRGISPREAARLQGFPDSFQILGNTQEIATQIGNAVPIQLGAAVARALLRRLQRSGQEREHAPDHVDVPTVCVDRPAIP